MRKHEFTIPIHTTPDELWKALTEPNQIQSWFAPEIRVTPGQGGSIWMSWGEGMEGESKIEKWEPGRHLTTSMGPAKMVDYIIESNGTETILRLVHSGFGEEASFDDEYESTRGGWITFLNMLKHRLERHPGAAAENVWIMRMTDVSAREAWDRIAATGELSKGIAVPGHLPGYGGFIMPELNDSYLAVFCEGKTCGLTITWILYGLPAGKVAEIRSHWVGLLDRLFPKTAVANT